MPNIFGRNQRQKDVRPATLHRWFLSATWLGVLLALAAPLPAFAQTCPWQNVCTYAPPSLPLAPPAMANPNLQARYILLAAPEGATSFEVHSGIVTVGQYGLEKGTAAFLSLPPTASVAKNYNEPETTGGYVRSSVGYPMAVREIFGGGVASSARIRGHTSGLGKVFRLAGYPFNQSNGDDAGFDYFGVYAPQAANFTATLPAAAYARFVSQSPNKNFWSAGPGPSVGFRLAAGQAMLVRTQGADPVVGASGFPIDGTLLTSDALISVTIGGRGYLFDSNNALLGGDDGTDGTVSVDYLGTQYVVAGFPGAYGAQLRVVAHQDGTTVRLNDTLVATLAAGETFVTPTPAGITYLETNLVAAVYQSAGLFGVSSDLALVQPVAFANKVGEVVFDVHTSQLGYVFVLLPTSSLASLTLNGASYTQVSGVTTTLVPNHAEWTAVMLPNLPPGQQVLYATADISVAALTGSSTGGSSFTYISRLRRPFCGNGVLDNDEECDDGNIASFDGCSSMCLVEDRYACSGTPSVCAIVTDAAAQTAQPNATVAAPISSTVNCQVSGCPDNTWCDTVGCVPLLNNAAYCSEAAHCVVNVCATDGRCGQPVGGPCASDAVCRDNACVAGYCVQPNADGEGAGFASCAASSSKNGRGRGAFSDWLAPLGLLGGWRLRRHRRRLQAAGRGAVPARLRSRLPAGLLLGLLAIVAMVPCPVWAAANGYVGGFGLDPLPTPQPGSPYLVVDGAAVPTGADPNARHAWALRLGAHHADRPLQVAGGHPRAVLGHVVTHQTQLRLGVNYGWRRRLRVGLSVPLQVAAAGGRVRLSPVAYPGPRAAGLGDATASAAWVLWRAPSELLRVAVAGELRLPTGRRAAYAGDASFAGSLAALLAGQARSLHWALQVAPWLRGGHGGALPQRLGDGLQVAAAGAIALGDPRVQLALELPLSVAFRGARPAYAAHNLWFDPLVSLRYAPHPSWQILLGGGPGASRARGEARWRLLAAVDYQPKRAVTRHAVAGAAAATTAAEPVTAAAPAPTPTPPKTPAEAPLAAAPEAVPATPAPAPEQPIAFRVQFALESANLDRTARAELRRLAAMLQARSDVALVKIMAYTDPTGSERHNVDLSAQRAAHVKRYLVAQGVPEALLACSPQGPKDFRADNETRWGRQSNRRAEFAVVLRRSP